MNKKNIVRFISVGGILTTLAVIFQSAPVFLPAIGLALSPLSTLPIAIAAFNSISLGVTVFISSALLLILVSIQESLIFLFTTGILGVIMGTMLYRKGIVLSILLSSLSLSLGMILLTFVVGISAFGDFTNSIETPIVLIIFIAFSFIYSGIWNVCIRRFMNYLTKIKLI